MRQLLNARNKRIVQTLSEGVYTLAEVGRQFGLSRQRVAKIYERYTGSGYKVRRHNRQQQKEADRQTRLASPRYFCKNCNKPVFATRRNRYCSAHCFRAYHNRDRRTLLRCSQCGRDYFRFRASAYTTTKKPNLYGTFCCLDCYFHFKKRTKVAYGKYKTPTQPL